MTAKPVPLRNRKLAALLAFLVPGLGHAYQGRWGKAILYAACILGLYLVGISLGEWKIVFWRWVSPLNDPEHFCYSYVLQALTGLIALPSIVQATLQHYGLPTILWGFGAEPPGEVYNGLYPRLGKIVDIGYIYTQAAGLLNILAIYDAYDGPALKDDPARADQSAEPKVEPAAPAPGVAEAGA